MRLKLSKIMSFDSKGSKSRKACVTANLLSLSKRIILTSFILLGNLSVENDPAETKWIFLLIRIKIISLTSLIETKNRQFIQKVFSVLRFMEFILFFEFIFRKKDDLETFELRGTWKFITLGLLLQEHLWLVSKSAERMLIQIVYCVYFTGRSYSQETETDIIISFLTIIIFILNYFGATHLEEENTKKDQLLIKLQRTEKLNSFLLNRSKNQIIIDPVSLSRKKMEISKSILSISKTPDSEGFLLEQ